MRRVLLLSDLPAHIQAIDAALRRDEVVVRTETNVERGVASLVQWQPDLLIVDCSLVAPGPALDLLHRDGLALIALVDETTIDAASALPSVDDFLLAPPAAAELRARVRRLDNTDEAPVARSGELIRRGALEIDVERYKVTVNGDVVDLTYKEYELLRFLASSPGKPFTREALLNQVWGYDYYGGSRTVDVHVRRIRAKIEEQQQFIETVRNVGYRFTEAN
jgi:two-component system alkaline phosphatase synthesis response regulator PhoP